VKQLTAVARDVLVVMLVCVLAGCDNLGGSAITYSVGPVEFAIDLSGHVHVSVGQQITTPLGRIGLEADWSKAVVDKAAEVLRDGTKDATKVVIDHVEDGQSQRDGFAILGKATVVCLDGRFVLSQDGEDKILLQAERNSTIKFVDARAAATACPPTPGDGQCRLTVAFDPPITGQHVPLAGKDIGGTVRGDLDDCHLLVFKYAPVAQRHFLGDRLAVSQGRFSGATGQVGSDNPKESGRSHVIEIVSANSAVTEAVEHSPRDANGDISFEFLPAGVVVQASANLVRD
jgi:hypothetical protein